MIVPPIEFRVEGETAFLVGSPDAPVLRGPGRAEAFVAALLEDPDNEATLKNALGIEDTTRLAEALIAALRSGEVRCFRTRRARRVLDPCKVVDLRELVEDEPLPPAATRTRFELALVDLYGRPLCGAEVTVLHNGNRHRFTTDGDGVVRFEEGVSRSAQVTVGESSGLRKALDAAASTRSDAPRIQPDDDNVTVVYDRGELLGPLHLVADTQVIVSIQPFVVLGRLVGMFFETDRDFLLPLSRDPVAEMRALYDRCTPCQVLIAGHTDTVGDADYNDGLSLARARSVRAFLTDDVDAWLGRYDPGAPGRWGAAEDNAMLDALPDASERPAGQSPVGWFQETRGLEVDGDLGPDTRRALITEYMAHDGTTLPQGVSVSVVGCGESFPLDSTGHELDVAPIDGVDDPVDRRVELFFFGSPSGIAPALEGEILGVESGQYFQWRDHALETYARLLEVQASDGLIGCHFEATSAYPADTLALLMRSARDALVASPNAKLTIFGHAAPTGSADADKALSDRRARFVQAVMTNDLAELEAVVEEDGGRS